MKLALPLSIIVALAGSTAYAAVDRVCAKRVAEQCYAQEKDKPDSARSGATAAEYCAAAAVIQCER